MGKEGGRFYLPENLIELVWVWPGHGDFKISPEAFAVSSRLELQLKRCLRRAVRGLRKFT